ncbi:hypothetical protein ACIRS1_19720 [Kitasatospora sp. NPDC101176]|uniref:hypothetical protein n=1 Tax=Kitasatospora sp. NPDC101176 TaxID=3364099 RepID=UPI0038225025
MGDIPAEQRRILQSPPPELVAAAAANPGGSIAAIDYAYIGDPDGYVPAEAVRGVWRVGPDGRLTGEFEENPGYGPPKDDFSRLTDSDHWLEWLGDPAAAVRGSIVDCLTSQAPGAVVEWVKIIDDPRYLTGGPRSPERDDLMIVRRAGLAVSFALAVTAPGRERDVLTGVFSWVAVRLDRPGERKDRVWLDLWADLDRAAAELGKRIYLVDEQADGGQ